MPTKSTIHALNVYAAVFQRLGTIPVRWDRSKKKFVYRLNHRELLFWYCCMSVVCCGMSGSGFVCVREIFVKVTNVDTHALVYLIFLGLMTVVVGCGGGLLLLIYGQVGATAWDNICIIEDILNTGN